MIVMKFGGSSTETSERIRRVVSIVEAYKGQNPVLVFSAMGKTTRYLLHAAQSVEKGAQDKALSLLKEIEEYHLNLLKEVSGDSTSFRCRDFLETCFYDLENLFKGLSILKDLSLKSRDKILSFGEVIATIIMEEALSSAGLKVKLVDARELILTDNNFSQADPLWEETQKNSRGIILPLIKEGVIPLTQGFIGFTKEGHTTTLGFEGSDYSGTLLGAALGAEKVFLWKTVPGLMTTDPGLDSTALPLKMLSYDEAAALTHLGASCIHTKAIAPVRSLGIPLLIKNTLCLEDEGTLISEKTEAVDGPRSIALLEDLVSIKISFNRGVSTLNISHSLLMLLQNHNISPHYLGHSKSGAFLLLSYEDAQLLQPSLGSLNDITWSVTEHLSLLSIVGEGLGARRDDYLTLVASLKGATVHHIFDDLSGTSISVLLDQDKAVSSLLKVHKALFMGKEKGCEKNEVCKV